MTFAESKLIMPTASFCSSIADIGFCTSVDTTQSAGLEPTSRINDRQISNLLQYHYGNSACDGILPKLPSSICLGPISSRLGNLRLLAAVLHRLYQLIKEFLTRQGIAQSEMAYLSEVSHQPICNYYYLIYTPKACPLQTVPRH